MAHFVDMKEHIKFREKQEKELLEKEKAITTIFMDHKIFVKWDDTNKYNFYYIFNNYSDENSSKFDPRLIIDTPPIIFVYQDSFKGLALEQISQILHGYEPIGLRPRFFLKVFNKTQTKYIYFLVEQGDNSAEPTAEAKVEATVVRALVLAIIKNPKLMSKDNYDIYYVCDNYNVDVKLRCSTFRLETIPDDKLVTVLFKESFNQPELISKIIKELNIVELSKNPDEFFIRVNKNLDEFFIRVNNPKGDKHIYIFLKKNMEGAAAATSAFYKKKSIKKKSIKKKSIKKKSLKQKKSLKTKKSLKQKKSKKSMKKKNKKF